MLERLLVDAGTHRGIALGIQVDQQHTLVLCREAGGKVHRGGGLADAALLVCDHEYLGHMLLLLLLDFYLPGVGAGDNHRPGQRRDSTTR